MAGRNDVIRPWALLLVAAELALACFVMVRFQFDLAKPLSWDLLWVVPVFLAHSLMPLSWRRPFLLAVTAGLLVRVLGVTAGAYVIVAGLLLIGLCHVPVAFRWRVLLILSVAAGLALVQMKIVEGNRHLALALPILGGIFMFRLILYLYTIRHEKPGAATPLERIGYFFLLPAPLAPFFPTLDYQVYLRSWYQKPAFETYQTGMLWISRGVVHLALYRLIYHFFSPPAEFVVDLAGVAAFCLSGYLIYLRVSGLFHIVSGILRLFGYALPETHRLYFFASDFSDYWRRINIYWKEFMTKLVFYPAFTALRRVRIGHQARLAVATIVVFIATAILHSYQVFWLRGSFEFHETDYWFWGVLGLFVVGNNLLDARRGPSRKSDAGWQWKRAAAISVRAVGMFVFFAVLWALWWSKRWDVFADVMKQGRNAPAWQVTMLLGILAAAVALGTLGQWAAHRGFNLFEERPGLKRSVATTVLPLLALGIVWQVHLSVGLPGWWGSKFDLVWIDHPNVRDDINRERSYYEGLLAGVPSIGADDERKVKDTVSDLRSWIYRKDFGPVMLWGAQWSTNHWGMHDHHYSVKKPEGHYRIAFSGASYVAGRGVKDGCNFESLLEDRLNADGKWVECLNFATGGHCTLQELADLEHRVVEFEPDALFLVCHSGESDRNLRVLAQIASKAECDLTYPYLEDLFARAGIRRGDREADIIRALSPFREELMHWTYHRIAEVCEERGIAPVWIYLPNTLQQNIRLAEEGHRYSREAGLTAIVLDNAYGGLPIEEVTLNKADAHPNELGHRLVAERLFEKLKDHYREIGMPDVSVFQGGAQSLSTIAQ